MNTTTSKKFSKYVDGQDRTLHFADGNATYMITTVPGKGGSYTYAVNAWYDGVADHMYFDRAADVIWAMKDISGDLRKWRVS